MRSGEVPQGKARAVQRGVARARVRMRSGKMPQGKSDALKFAIIGFVIWIVLQFIFGMIVFGTISAAMYGLMNSVDMGSYNYGYHGSW